MFLRDKSSGDLVEVMDVTQLVDPNGDTVRVVSHAGEERGDPVTVSKTSLEFPSGEALPKCWVDSHYRVSF